MNDRPTSRLFPALRNRSRRIVTSAALAAVVAVAVVPTAQAQTTTVKPVVPTTAGGVKTTTSRDSLVAAMKSGKKTATITVYKAPDGKVVQTKVKNPLKSRAVFHVLEERNGYYYVLLPTRPNGSKGWIRKTDVSTFRTPFRVVISLSEKRLAVYEGDLLIIAANIAIGKPATPTPTGEFYVYWVRSTSARQKAGWGDYVIGLSGFGNNSNYGEGRVGIHGTDNSSSIGTPASAGCVRVTNEVIRQMKDTLYLGTPVTIVA
jgi:lipoprotein-anchoring transpeptidase ErfK/SrfK